MTTYYLTQRVSDCISNCLNLEKTKLSDHSIIIETISNNGPIPSWNSNLHPDDPIRDHWRQKNKEQFLDPEKRNRHLQACLERSNHKDKIWVNNGKDNKRIREELLVDCPGWVRGRLIPKEKINLMAANRKVVRDPQTGRFVSKENI